jgi:hypothetical protein
MQNHALACPYLSLRVLACQDPTAMLGARDRVGTEAPYLERMQGAQRNLTAAAASD